MILIRKEWKQSKDPNEADETKKEKNERLKQNEDKESRKKESEADAGINAMQIQKANKLLL